MDQLKIGTFLKELRNEKNLTQEQLAEKFNISRRTVSRWETGSNMPDLDILVEMADFYNVDLRELLDGERKSEKMDKELEETVLKVADYSNEQKRKLARMMQWYFIAGCISFILHFIVILNRPEEPQFFYGLLEGTTIGIPVAIVFVGAFLTTRYASKIRELTNQITEHETNSQKE